MIKEELLKEIEKMTTQYEELRDNIHDIQAIGSLSEKIDISDEYDTTFDDFFDSDDIRMKYHDWDCDAKSSNLEKTNSELFDELDEIDLKRYLSFLSNAIGMLEDKLHDLQSHKY